MPYQMTETGLQQWVPYDSMGNYIGPEPVMQMTPMNVDPTAQFMQNQDPKGYAWSLQNPEAKTVGLRLAGNASGTDYYNTVMATPEGQYYTAGGQITPEQAQQYMAQAQQQRDQQIASNNAWSAGVGQNMGLLGGAMLGGAALSSGLLGGAAAGGGSAAGAGVPAWAADGALTAIPEGMGTSLFTGAAGGAVGAGVPAWAADGALTPTPAGMGTSLFTGAAPPAGVPAWASDGALTPNPEGMGTDLFTGAAPPVPTTAPTTAPGGDATSKLMDWIKANPLAAASLGLTAYGLLNKATAPADEAYKPAAIDQSVVNKYGGIPGASTAASGGTPNYQGFQTLGQPSGLLAARLDKIRKGLL